MAELLERQNNGSPAPDEEDLPVHRGAEDTGVDVLLDVPDVHVGSIRLTVEDLHAQVQLHARVLNLLELSVGADVGLGKVELEIDDVAAQAVLKVRLERVAQIVDRLLTTIDNNPQILEHLTRGLGEAVEKVGEGVEEVGAGAGKGVEQIGEGAGEGVKELGEGAGKGVEGLGEGAGKGVEGLGEGAGKGVEEVGKGAGEGVSNLGEGAGEGVGNLTKENGTEASVDDSDGEPDIKANSKAQYTNKEDAVPSKTKDAVQDTAQQAEQTMGELPNIEDIVGDVRETLEQAIGQANDQIESLQERIEQFEGLLDQLGQEEQDEDEEQDEEPQAEAEDDEQDEEESKPKRKTRSRS